MDLLGYFLALFVGISLGLIGGGGSILAMPILVYIFHFTPHTSTSYSLFIVGISALVGSIKHYRLKNLHLPAAIIFGLPSIVSLLLVRKYVLPNIPTIIFYINGWSITKDILIIIFFGLLMIAASFSMISNNNDYQNNSAPNKLKLALIGFIIGIITGFLGAGGGFLIIPALIFFAALTMKQAIGTSLIIIAINALIGFAGDVLNKVPLDYSFLIYFSLISIIGIYIGIYLSKKIDGNKLKPAFGWLVLIEGIYIISREIFFR